jgi:hypothetical protein
VRRVRIPSAFDGGDGVGVAAASLGLLTGVSAVSPQPSGVAGPLLVAESILAVAIIAMLAVLMRRRRRQCAG